MVKSAGSTVTCRQTSLLPYLQRRGAGERLKLSLLQVDAAGAPRSYPFQLLDDSAPYCREVHAAVVTDAGTVLKKVVLQLQKDHYPASADPMRRVTNADLDRAWQAGYAAHLDDHDTVLLSSQTDRDERPVPQAPLFYCREKEEFFHPVCPSCGLPLSLCTDEEYLRKEGLAPYASSLKRYLYCGACCRLGLQEIYLYERDHADPLSLKDRWALIERSGAVDDAMDPEGTFPCARCGDRDACFGERRLARLRMIPFSFYPFYMLVRSAPSMCAADFLAQLAGAPQSELQTPPDPELKTGEDTTLYPARDGRSFLEILFLKLSFLHEVLLQSPSSGGRVAMERIWVTLAPLSRSLPLFWNFKVTVFDAVAPAVPKPVCTDRFAHLGLVWFRTLVSSREVTTDGMLHAVVDRLATAKGAERVTSGDRLAELLVPQNIFWESGGKEVPEEWRSLWKEACSLGLRLLDGSCGGAPEEVAGPLGALLSELRAALLAAPAAAEIRPRPGADDEEVLCSVVAKLIERYTGLEECRTASETDEFEAATVIIPPHPRPATAPPAGEEALMETVLSPQLAKEGPPLETEWGDEPVMETVILSAGAAPGGVSLAGKGAPGLPQEGTDLLETVLLAPARVRPNGAKRRD